jgi:cell division protein FtsQ
MVSLTEFKVTVYEKSIIGYLKYMGQCMYFDKDGIVVETTSKELEGIVPVEGIDFDHIVVNEKIPVNDQETFDTILAVTQLIHNYQIAVDTIDISKDLEITLYIGQVRVELGKNSAELSEKINDLSSITEVMDDESGVLDMREYSQSDKGYTFKRD